MFWANSLRGEDQRTLETAAIKPALPGDTNWRMEFSHGRMRIENRSVRDLIRAAYGLSADSQIVAGPAWMTKEMFDIDGTFDASSAHAADEGNESQRAAVIGELLRTLLSERFAFTMHAGQATLPVYALVATGKQGTNISPAVERHGSTFFGIVGPAGRLSAHGVSMPSLASRLTNTRDADERVVLDETGKAGNFDWTLRWNANPMAATTQVDDAPPLSIALQEQLGLKLVSQKRPVPVVYVDHVSRPTDN